MFSDEPSVSWLSKLWTAATRSLLLDYDPNDLAMHVAEQARDRIAQRAAPCAGNEVGWQAGPYRWFDVLQSLARGRNSALPHPDFARWRDRGLRLTGRTQVEQFDELARRTKAYGDARPLVFGSAGLDSLSGAAARLAPAAHPRDSLAAAVTLFAGADDWPMRICFPGHPEGGSE